MDTVLHRQWHSLGLRGIAAILFAVAAFVWPGLTLVGLFLVFGAYVLLDGVLAMATAIRIRPRPEMWAFMVEGVIGIFAGIAALFLTPLSGPLIGTWIGVWALATGCLEVWLAFRMRKFAFSGPYWALGAAISLLLGALLLIRPEQVATSLVLLLGLYAVVFGVAMLAIAWAIRRIERRLTPPNHGLGGRMANA